MQLSLTPLLFLLTGALAFPTNDIPILERRKKDTGTFGNIASFTTTDCAGTNADAIAHDGNEDCVVFAPKNNNIGINWGHSFWFGSATALVVYKDNACKAGAAPLVVAPQYPDKVGTESCVDLKAHGGPWGSVRFCHSKDLTLCNY